MNDDDLARRRAEMVQYDLRGRGIRDPEVLRAMGTVLRERFVPSALARAAYDDRALPIDRGQTISQPFIVAAMAEAARVGPGDRVLEVGTGSGYAAAVLRELGAEVTTVERLSSLADDASATLLDAGYDDVAVVVGDGTLGWPDGAPYDAIVVAAAGPAPPRALVEQLVDGGRLVMPVGPRGGAQELVRFTRDGDDLGRENLGGVRFVPLIGEQGYPA